MMPPVRVVLSGLLTLWGLSMAPSAGAATLAQATTLANAGRADEATFALQSVIATDPHNDGAQSLLCRIYKTEEKYDDAIRACEAASRIAPQKSSNALELARAYGAKADHSGMLTGLRLVGKIRGSFEKAVELDPRNVDALSDLGEFYVDAPSSVGGGTDKAKDVAAKLLPLNAARGHKLLAMIAAKSGDNGTAEAEYAREVAAAHSPEAYVDLATYFFKRKDWERSAASAMDAIRIDTQHGADTVDAARLLLKLGRGTEVAEKGLRDYLASRAQVADVPAFQAHTLLGEVLAKRGDKPGAKAEFNAALALARDYAPARKGAAA